MTALRSATSRGNATGHRVKVGPLGLATAASVPWRIGSPRFAIRGALLALLIAGGCQRGPQMVPVHGQVVFRDQPLTFGSVMFQPVAGGDPARARIESDGTFRLTTWRDGDGVVVGQSRVRITAFESQQKAARGETHQELALGRSAIPGKYSRFGTSGIVIDVQPDMALPLTITLDE